MATSLAAELREGYLQVSGALSEDALALVSRARDSITYGLAERNRLLAEIVAAYRAGPRQVWGPVILDLLAPALVELVQWYGSVQSGVDEDEIRQQLVMEILSAAAAIPMRGSDGVMKARLLARAHTYVVRWLVRELRQQGRWCSWEVFVEPEK